MKVGAFSVSLAVKNIEASKEFYEKLGFEAFGGDISQKWLMMRNGDHVIGLFEGMFEGNLLTFNPGWNQSCEAVEDYEDVREIQAKLKEAGVDLTSEVPADTEGPGSFFVMDPDGNQILFDQHR